MAQETKKPEHNKHDNIFEIRKIYPHIDDAIAQAIVGKVPRSPRRVGNALIHDHVESFIRRIRQGNFKLPVWKIVIPDLEQENGVIYYVLQETQGSNNIFRGTYGYGGTGPHESALVEEVLIRMNCTIEVRNGDYLLGFIK